MPTIGITVINEALDEYKSVFYSLKCTQLLNSISDRVIIKHYIETILHYNFTNYITMTSKKNMNLT